MVAIPSTDTIVNILYSVIAAVILFVGMFYALRSTVSSIKEDIGRLEKKQDKYNNLQERTAIVERDTETAHKRIDGVKSEIKELRKEHKEDNEELKDLIMDLKVMLAGGKI